MIQTTKRYKQQGDVFFENNEGFVVGFEWTDNNGFLRRTIYIANNLNTVLEFSEALCRYELFDPETNDWVLRKVENSKATQNDYVYAATGEFEPVPYENDLNAPVLNEADEIIGYGTKLKTGLVKQFGFWFNLLLPLYTPAMQDVQVRKFGATGFN